jgi:hypothetical protein
MERLQQAAQKLRESVQAMAQREPSARRDRAARKAREALLETQEAMADLPASLRVGNATASAPGHVTPEYAARLRSMPRHDAESLDNPIEHRSGIEYTAGGVGLEDQQRLDRLAQARDYNLKAVFALNTGNYVADVDVVLQDQSGRRLIDYEADGPYFVAKVPPGRYTLVATYEGEPQRHAVSIGDHGARTEYFHWNAHPTTNLLAR